MKNELLAKSQKHSFGGKATVWMMRHFACLGTWAGVAIVIGSNVQLEAAEPVPVANWNFGEEEPTPLQPHGGVHRDLPGPRPPEYPDFEPDNTAVRLDGQGSYLSFEDTGMRSKFDFTNGDAISLEAWVQLNELHDGENFYVIGKGRTGAPGFAADNQNWALRVRERNEKGSISFLFASIPEEPRGSGAHWHRWTTTNGFIPGPGWHHIAVSYRFGDPQSIRGWIDGQPQPGTWDLGGATEKPPVVDNDDIWIGSSMRGNVSSSFRGSLDSIAIHRELLDDAILKTRFRRIGKEPTIQPAPESPPDLADVPPGQVLVAFHEGMPAHDRWLNQHEIMPPETLRWQTDSFLLNRLPQRFDAWGIRDGWKAPVLVRFAADIQLPPGQHKFLMRTRGLSRLWVNDQVIARSQPLKGSPSGEEPMTPPAAPPLPGLRIAEHRQQEVTGTATVNTEGTCRIVLETFVGGKRFRTDPGEICVAIETSDGSSFTLLQPDLSDPVALTDANVLGALARQADELQEFDDVRRRAASASQDEFWKMRHAAAREWAEQHPAPPAPDKNTHPIDAFLNRKIQRALAASSQTPLEEAQRFHRDVLPILRDNCFRCHGEKANGGLLLNSLATAQAGGDSGLPAIHPGNPQKSELITRIRATDPDERMPPGETPLSPEQISTLETWIAGGAQWPAPPVTMADVTAPPVLDDAAFLRRIYLDTVGVIPSAAEARDFLEDASPDKRQRVIDELLADERWADHWMSYWQDVLAENPTLINASLNTTGPFRWFLLDSLRDNKPLDRMVTELVLLRGNPHEGGSAGFGIAANNDAPFAAKGQIVAGAFLGVELQCARCHDSPYHSSLQKDLYALAAMFEKKPVTVPASSRVPLAFFEQQQRESLIKVTLKPDELVLPEWPFAEISGCADDDLLERMMQRPNDSRERLAALITSPQNMRFARVMVNRIWRRFIGAGIVEPPSDWEGHSPSHQELLQWLAQELMTHDYDVKYISRLIFTSDLYQRESHGSHLATAPELRFFVAPDRRRMSAEQLVDSLCAASGRPFDSEELTFDPDGRRPASNRLTLGIPQRAWMFASLANERDRPSLNLPRARAITDMMEAFGWSGSRQNPRTDRETSSSILQPGVLENSTSAMHFLRATSNSHLAEAALQATSPGQLLETIFLTYLGRRPSTTEIEVFESALARGFDERLLPESEIQQQSPLPVLPVVTWSNHLRPEANEIALILEERARAGAAPDPRLRAEWREVYEDVIWSVVNISEFVWIP